VNPAGSGGDRPVVAVLTTRWELRSESGWAIRQVAGAMACAADVHVVTPQGARPAVRTDSVFTLHETGTPVQPVDDLSRDALIAAFSQAGAHATGEIDSQFGRILDRGQIEPWEAAAAVLTELQPDRVVIAGHLNLGALSAVDRSMPGLPLSVVPLAVDSLALGFPHFRKLLDRADSLLALSEAEAAEVASHLGSWERVHWIGIPLAANPSALSEPNTWVGDTGYVLVLTDTCADDDDEPAVLARAIRMAFPDPPVGISATDNFHVWHRGRRSSGWPVERASDLARLMAWAALTVDLRPGALFSRRCVESLLYATPIVVPSGSRAADLARRSGGGLWYCSPGELIWSVEAMLDPSTRATLSQQGRSYAEAGYGTTEGFIQRVLQATGLANDEIAPVRQGEPATGSPQTVTA